MDFERLRNILTTFADPGTTVEISKGNLLVQINDKAHLARVRIQDGDVVIEDETGESMPAVRWIILRVARLPILAERILQFIPATKHFINPEANLFDNLDESNVAENEHVPNAMDCAGRLLGRRFAYTTSVIYLTSDAGEGKTTLIQELARDQALAYKNRRTDWLLVPIALGGRPFMRFDDMIAGYLTNKLRFPLFYYDAFIELVKLGVIIPAFDGFEETLVVNSSGDAYSAIGSLMASLDQQGTVVISARKAFFEYQELKLQARLYDSIGKNSVAFSRIQLLRWKRKQFLEYASLRGYERPEELFDAVASALHSSEHALLTRAVLANRLVTVASAEADLEALLRKLGSSPDDYFPVFVDTIIEREAFEKWLDSSGEAAQPLLSIAEHRELLTMIAQEMWIQSTESLKADLLELIAALFCESKGKSSAILHQVQQRIKQHALIVPSDSSKSQFGFDHEEFRHYFFGLALAKLLSDPAEIEGGDLPAMLRKGALPSQVLESVHCGLRSSTTDTVLRIIERLRELAAFDPQTSYLHENSAQLMLRIVSHQELGPVTLEGFTFGAESLEGVFFSDTHFIKCVFRATRMKSSKLWRCKFTECVFERLDLSGVIETSTHGTIFDNCEFSSIAHPTRDVIVFDPHAFGATLKAAGFGISSSQLSLDAHEQSSVQVDQEFMDLQKLIRCFSSRTHITDALIKTKFGKQAGTIFDNLLPKLIESGIIYEDTYRGGGKQTLYKLDIGMMQLNDILEKSQGNGSRFFVLITARNVSSQ